MNEICCLEPVLIVNPSINQSVVRFTHICVDGILCEISDSQRYDIISGDSPSSVLKIPYAHNISETAKKNLSKSDISLMQHRLEKFVDDSYLFNAQTSECIPLYKFVPCGKCDCCQSRKLASLVQRCDMQLQESRVPCYFVTLTYNNEHYPPVGQDDLFKRHVQLWKKRLSKYCSKFSENKLRFVVVQEKGDKGRYHFHTIVYNLPQLHENPIRDFYLKNKLFQYCWRDAERVGISYVSFDDYLFRFPSQSNVNKGTDPCSRGYVNVTQVKNTSSAIRYITKYAFKDFKSGNFRSLSCNLGLAFVKSLRPHIVKSSDGVVEYCDFLTNKVKKLHLSKYYIDKLFPSESKLIPLVFRRFYSSSLSNLQFLIDFKGLQVDKETKKWAILNKLWLQERFPFMEIFGLYDEHIYLKGFKDLQSYKISESELVNSVLFQTLQSLSFLDEYEIEYDNIVNQLKERCEYFTKISMNSPKQSLVGVANKFIRDVKYSQSKSFL